MCHHSKLKRERHVPRQQNKDLHLKARGGECQDCLASADLDSSSCKHSHITNAQMLQNTMSNNCPRTKGAPKLSLKLESFMLFSEFSSFKRIIRKLSSLFLFYANQIYAVMYHVICTVEPISTAIHLTINIEQTALGFLFCRFKRLFILL